MRRRIAGGLLVAFLSIGIAASQVIGPRFSAFKATTLAGAAEVITIQQPASNPKRVRFESAQIYCSVDCVVELERDGAAATATTLTTVDISKYGSVTATAWSGSDVGNGTTINFFRISGGKTEPIDLGGLALAPGGGTGENLTFRSDSITGDIEIFIVWRED